MSSIITEDLRSIKTERILFDTFFSLLQILNFKKITVKKICEQSLISRAAFYAHFNDKYDLLNHWMSKVWLKYFDYGDIFGQLEKKFAIHIEKTHKILKNLLYDADNETFEIIFNFLLSTQSLTVEKDEVSEIYKKNVVMSNFFAGGVISYLLWQIKNRFPSDVPIINEYFCEMINELKNLKIK